MINALRAYSEGSTSKELMSIFVVGVSTDHALVIFNLVKFRMFSEDFLIVFLSVLSLLMEGLVSHILWVSVLWW